MAAITGPFTERQVRIYRDSLSTPWGFRLQGGRDFKAPLTIQRVFVGSPAEGDLHRGDIILAIENHDVTGLIHKEAQDIIKSSGGSLSLRVRRGTVITPRSKTPPPSFPQSFRGRPASDLKSPVSPAGSFGFVPTQYSTTASPSQAPTFGVDYRPSQPGFAKPRQLPVRRNIGPGQGRSVDDSMMHRIQQSLNDVIWQPHPEYEVDDEPYQAKPVSSLRQQFSVPDPMPQKPVRRSRPRQNPPSWVRSSSPPSLNEPGWVPKNMQKTWKPLTTSRPAPVSHTPAAKPYSPQPSYQPSQDTRDGPAAWQGTLRSAGATKPWESDPRTAAAPVSPSGHKQVHFQPDQVPIHQPRVQNVHYAPGQAPQYQQQPDQASNDARVVHLQYNSPIGLYSRSNVEDTLTGQTMGRPGQGSLQVSGGGPPKEFDPSKSSVLRVLQEESRGVRQPFNRLQSGGQEYHDPYQGGMQQQQGYDAHYNGEEEAGASEF